MRNERTDPAILLAQLPSRSPAEIDALLRDEAQYCVAHRTGSQLLEEIHEQLINSEDPSILISIARYGSNIEASNKLWERGSTHPCGSDSEILREGLRRACVLNRLIPLSKHAGQFWDEKKIEWFINSLTPKPSKSESFFGVGDFDLWEDAEDFDPWEQQEARRGAIWWDFVNLLQNESLPFSIIADAISGQGLFARINEITHISLLHHISLNPLLQNPVSVYENGDYQGWLKLKAALFSLPKKRMQEPEYRSAAYEVLISLSPQFYNGDIILAADHAASVPTDILKSWKYHDWNGKYFDEMATGKPALMPIIAFAAWPSEVPASKETNLFSSAVDYIVKDLTLSQMFNAAKKDRNLFCLLAIWNRRIMLSDVKRTMLRNLIESTDGPIETSQLIEIYEKRLKIWASWATGAETKWSDFGAIPKFADIKWQIRLKNALGTSTKHDEVVFEVAKAIDRDQRGSTLDIARRGADRVFGWLIFWIFVSVAVDQFFMQGEGLKEFIGLLPDARTQQ